MLYLSFLQRVSIACYAERCISHDRLSDRLSHAGIMPKRLQVRFTDGTLDVRLLRVSDSTIRIGVARGGGGGVGWRA